MRVYNPLEECPRFLPQKPKVRRRGRDGGEGQEGGEQSGPQPATALRTEVMACRYVWSATSPAANTPATDVAVVPGSGNCRYPLESCTAEKEGAAF